MSNGQYYWLCVAAITAIGVTGWALWRSTRARLAEWWQWRSLRRRARQEPWPFDWRVSCPQLRQPIHFRIRRR